MLAKIYDEILNQQQEALVTIIITHTYTHKKQQGKLIKIDFFYF